MSEPQEVQQEAGGADATLTDEEIETRPLGVTPRASVDDESDPGDPGDAADDAADDAGDDSGDTTDTSDTGDDTGDDSGDSND